MRIPRHHSKQCGYRGTIPTLVPACSPLSTTQAGREKALDVGALEVETTCRGEMPGERHAPLCSVSSASPLCHLHGGDAGSVKSSPALWRAA